MHNFKNKQRYGCVHRFKKGYYIGSIFELTIFILSPKYDNRLIPIDSNKLFELYDKTKPGFSGWYVILPKGNNFHINGDEIKYPILNKKRFKKWVEKNHYKLLKSKKKLQSEKNEVLRQEYLEEVFYDFFEESK